MKLTVFGASGPTGHQVVDQAVERGHTVTAVVQSAVPESRFSDAARVVEADVYAGDDIKETLSEETVVCNLLRHSKLTAPDYRTVSGQTILDAMESTGCSRYLTVVPAVVRREGEPCGIGESLAVTLYRLLHPLAAEDAADHATDVRRSELDWTVIRVLRLTDGTTTRQYTTGDIKLGIGSVSHGDVASFLLDCCERGIYLRMQPKIRT